MPTYSYACSACGHRFDSVQSIHAAPLTECPECHGDVRRVISAAAVTFKGSGFYRTDSRAGSGAAAPAASATSSSSASSS